LYLKEKQCSKCGKIKPLDGFSKLQDKNQVYFSICKECNMERSLERKISDQDYDIVQMLITRLSFSDKCFVCGISQEDSRQKFGEPLQIDHLQPFSKGGSLSIDNAILLCKECNLSKAEKSLREFLYICQYSQNDIDNKVNELNERLEWASLEYKRIGTYLQYNN
jgi:5-methylcytosine-specific restriction endonuclease McrA